MYCECYEMALSVSEVRPFIPTFFVAVVTVVPVRLRRPRRVLRVLRDGPVGFGGKTFHSNLLCDGRDSGASSFCQCPF